MFTLLIRTLCLHAFALSLGFALSLNIIITVCLCVCVCLQVQHCNSSSCSRDGAQFSSTFVFALFFYCNNTLNFQSFLVNGVR